MYKKTDGFTLIELIVVIAVLAILIAIALPRLNGFRELAERKVCEHNIKQLEKEFQIYMIDNPDQLESPEVTDFILIYELDNKICPSNGIVSYSKENGFECSSHNKIEEEDPPEGEVPWL